MKILQHIYSLKCPYETLLNTIEENTKIPGFFDPPTKYKFESKREKEYIKIQGHPGRHLSTPVVKLKLLSETKEVQISVEYYVAPFDFIILIFGLFLLSVTFHFFPKIVFILIVLVFIGDLAFVVVRKKKLKRFIESMIQICEEKAKLESTMSSSSKIGQVHTEKEPDSPG